MTTFLTFWLLAAAPDPGLLAAKTCAGCHEDQARAWKQSRHAVAFTNGIFQREYRDQPRAWCVSCHVPVRGQPTGDGVGCAACHVEGGRIVAARQLPGSPHRTDVRPGFGSPDLCARCHQFNFPVFAADGSAARYTDEPMQDTVAQFRRGPHAGDPRGCRACHDPHGFPGAHDPGMLERAVAFEQCRSGGDVVLTVANVGAGHNVPTGDVHRHLNARAWKASAPESLYEAFFGRRFEPLETGGKKTTWDSTLPPGARRRFVVPLASLGGEPDEPISFDLRYVYTADEHPRRSRDPGEPTYRVIHESRHRFQELPPCP